MNDSDTGERGTAAETGVSDPVNPPHYKQGGIECIDALQAALSPEEFRGFLKGQIIKYLWRANHKGATLIDHQKAAWYLDRLNKLTEAK